MKPLDTAPFKDFVASAYSPPENIFDLIVFLFSFHISPTLLASQLRAITLEHKLCSSTYLMNLSHSSDLSEFLLKNPEIAMIVFVLEMGFPLSKL